MHVLTRMTAVVCAVGIHVEENGPATQTVLAGAMYSILIRVLENRA